MEDFSSSGTVQADTVTVSAPAPMGIAERLQADLKLAWESGVYVTAYFVSAGELEALRADPAVRFALVEHLGQDRKSAPYPAAVISDFGPVYLIERAS